MNILTVSGVLIIAYGLLFFVIPPKLNNSFYGIRTKLNTKNETVWAFSQRLFAFASLFIGFYIFIIGLFKLDLTKLGFAIALSMIAIWRLGKFIIHKMILRKFPEA